MGSTLHTDGLISYYGLTAWWLGELSEFERAQIIATLQPPGALGDVLTSGAVLSDSQHVVSFLGNLAGWFNNPEGRNIAKKILSKGESLASSGTPLDQHFFYQQMIEVYYKDRSDPTQLQVAISACKQQIAIASKAAKVFQKKYRDLPLPSHKGYEQMVIILEKSKCYQEAIDLCKKAKDQGWIGNWDQRIEKCAKKINKV